ARRSAGSAARYWATVVAVMLATIPAAARGRELYGSVGREPTPRLDGDVLGREAGRDDPVIALAEGKCEQSRKFRERVEFVSIYSIHQNL
ncbi:MAG: hypothetical protein DLM73_09800, partial [Chthoniobacterales bacterium]